MTNAKWMMVGLLMGFLASSALSCGPATKACGPKECPFGCCDAAGTCQASLSDGQCGTQGAACAICGLAQRCSLGVCTNIGQSGGPGGGSGGGFTGGGSGGGGGVTGGGTGGGRTGGGTGGGGTGGGGTGGGVTGGGTGGGVTGGGTGGGVTGGGGGTTCSPTNCTGCCSGNSCVPLTGNNDTVCGAGGSSCVNCAATGGSCNVSAHTCIFVTPDAGSCTGCTNGAACVPYATSSQSMSTCGGGADLCASCAGQTCEAGNCTSQALGTPISNGRVRLIGGNGINTGRLEVFANGGWGQVCDDLITSDATNGTAKVVCRDLGFTAAVNAGTVTQAGNYTGVGDFFLLDQVSCTGTETQLLQCAHDPFGVEDCLANEAVFINCGP